MENAVLPVNTDSSHCSNRHVNRQRANKHMYPTESGSHSPRSDSGVYAL